MKKKAKISHKSTIMIIGQRDSEAREVERAEEGKGGG